MTRNSTLFLVTLATAALLLVRAADALWNSLGAHDWPAVNAIVTESGVGWLEHQRANYKPVLSYEIHLRYAYHVGGNGYTGSRVRFSPWGMNENFNPFLFSILRKYPVGAHVVAHFNPRKPSDAVLEPQFAFANWVFLIGGIASAIGCVTCMRRVEAEKRQASAAAHSAQA